MKKLKYIILAAVTLTSCNYLDIEPVGQVIPHKVSDYRALLTSAYYAFPRHKETLGWPSDEVGYLTRDNYWYTQTINNVIWQESSQMTEYEYESFFKTIFYANEVIDKIDNAQQDVSESKEQIKAEAYALRAYLLFDLVNMYAKWYDPMTAATDKGVPFSGTIDIGQTFPRHTIEQNYTQIFADIEAAQALMQVDVQPGPETKYRFSKLALTAILSRIYLYRAEWDKALSTAESIMPQCKLQPMVGLKYDDPLQPYKHTSSEVILALEKCVTPDRLSTVLSNKFMELYDSEGDLRWGIYTYDELDLNTWEPYYVTRKSYAAMSSIRASEVYLNAAEAAANLALTQGDKLETARKYLTELQTLRFKTEAAEAKRAAVEQMSASELLSEIADERARELQMEGHRWFDLRRTTRPQIKKTVEEKEYTLLQNDARYTLAFPRSAQAANPELRN